MTDQPAGTIPDGLPRPAPAIYPAMIAVLRDVEAVGKERNNQAQNYRFRSIDDILNAIHPSLSKAGIFLAPEVQERQIERVEGREPGKGSWHVHLTVRHRFYACDGSHVDVTTIGSAMDSGDKASNKAMSAALKYALIEAFAIPLEDTDDGDHGDHGPAPRGGAGPEVRQQASEYRQQRQDPAPGPAKVEPWTTEQLAKWGEWKNKIGALAGGKERFTATNGSLKKTGATFDDYMAHFQAIYDELAKDQPPH